MFFSFHSPSCSCAMLEEFRLAGPEVHVVNKLANEAVQSRCGLRYLQGLRVLHSSRLLKHSCPAYVGAADILNNGGGGLGGGGLGGGGLGGGLGGGGGGEGGGGLGGSGLGGGLRMHTSMSSAAKQTARSH